MSSKIFMAFFLQSKRNEEIKVFEENIAGFYLHIVVTHG